MEKKLERNQQNKMIAGVASGLAEYFSIDVTLVRILFILMVLFHFAGIPVYIILWIAIPEKPFFKDFPNFDADYRVKEEPLFTSTGQKERPFYPVEKKSSSARLIAGLVLIAVGCWFMLAEFGFIPDWFSIFKLWPVVLIALGIVILSKSGKKTSGFANTPPVSDWDTESKTDAADKNDNQPLA